MTRSRAERYAEEKLRLYGAPVPDHLKHGSGTRAANLYGCDCKVCLPTGRRKRPKGEELTGVERGRRLRAAKRGQPVPPGVKHGLYAYEVYRCRCDVCTKANNTQRHRQRNAWRADARGTWTTSGATEIIHWPPASAGPDWACPDCGWAPQREAR